MRAISTLILALATAFTVLTVSSPQLESSIGYHSPFRHTGDGKITLVDTHTGERLAIVYRDARGRYHDAALTAVNHTLRCHGDGLKIPISLKLVELIDNIQDHFGAEEVRVVSGYRSHEHNAALRRRSKRVAHNSLHIQGLAMDIRMSGVSKVALAKYARSLKAGGVGLYRRSNFIHIDVGPVRNW